MFRKKIPSGFFESLYQESRRKLMRTSFRELMNYMDQFTNDYMSALNSFRKNSSEIYLLEMKRAIASMQAVVDELTDDINSKAR